MARRVLVPPATPSAANFSFLSRSRGSSSSKRRGGREPTRGAALPGGPNVDQPMQRILFKLQTELVARRAGRGAFAAAEASALIADDRLNGGEQLGGGHHADGDARAPEDGFDDLAVAVARHDHAVLDGVAAHDAAGGHQEAENGIAG